MPIEIKIIITLAMLFVVTAAIGVATISDKVMQHRLHIVSYILGGCAMLTILEVIWFKL